MNVSCPKLKMGPEAVPDSTSYSETLSSMLGHNFSDPDLLSCALTHRSAQTGAAKDTYERLEFLGDRILGLVIAEQLYHRFPDENEGDLAKRHSAVVQEAVLAQIARALNIGPYIQMSVAENGAGGRNNDHILCDVIEAIIGALYLDAGLSVARTFIERHWASFIEKAPEPPQDPKTKLQEWLQGHNLPLPVYEIARQSGPDHDPLFTIRLDIDSVGCVEAEGKSKRKAEKQAAQNMLAHIAQKNHSDT